MPGAAIELMRPSHWVKNVFVLAPIVFAGRLVDPWALGRVAIALLSFCAAASAVYAFNDIRDRDCDRNHPVKRDRPVASGRVSLALAGSLAAILAAIALAAASALGGDFLLVALFYLGINLLYTLWLKQVVILDVMSIAAGFVLRVAGGGAAIGVELSAWLLLCTIFLALFLAFSKRRHELALLADQASKQRRVLDHYGDTFLDQMINVVTASSVITYALYSVSPGILERFGHRFLLATMPFVLFGVFRYLYLTYQHPGKLNPTESVVRDWPSLVNVALWGAAVVMMLYGL
ncbi:MAG: decaprenyl-phosphate phosphoribosyltransferase [Acidobacteriota bacterium]|nr:decaprenyl-phosphate phosphoribosyltransferase [Acidobacteriota bacterium]